MAKNMEKTLQAASEMKAEYLLQCSVVESIGNVWLDITKRLLVGNIS